MFNDSKTTLEEILNVACQWCVVGCCPDDCPIQLTQDHYTGRPIYTQERYFNEF